jgi:hypothetical protein
MESTGRNKMSETLLFGTPYAPQPQMFVAYAQQKSTSKVQPTLLFTRFERLEMNNRQDLFAKSFNWGIVGTLFYSSRVS